MTIEIDLHRNYKIKRFKNLQSLAYSLKFIVTLININEKNIFIFLNFNLFDKKNSFFYKKL